MRFLRALTTITLLSLAACSSSGSPEDEELTQQEKDEQLGELRASYVGTWTGTLTPQTGAASTFTLTIEAVPAGTTPQCGTVELGAGVAARCITIYQTRGRGTLTTSDGTFESTVVDGTLDNVEARFELPSAGWLNVSPQGGGSYHFADTQNGQLQGSRK